jgi:endothelin-converting enzyme/putative endopeptidase
MVHSIRVAFDRHMDGLDWMSPATKAKAKNKLKAVAEKFGYPEIWRDYSSVDIWKDDFLGNVRRAGLLEHKRGLGKIGTKADRKEWFMTPPTVNAYYSPEFNDINFPAGILQPPFFDPAMDDAVNFGAIGVVIGHEITHGFDDQGRHYDADGNLADWWTPEDGKRFEERSQCLVREYGNFAADGEVKLNGKLTLGENTADNGGARISYLALKKLVGRSAGKREGLTPEQRFFIGMARVWCSNERPEQRRLQAQTDPHSLAEYRVNGTFENMPEFAAAWSCKPGDRMVSAKPCRVW